MITLKDLSTPEVLRALREARLFCCDQDGRGPGPTTVFVGSRLIEGGASQGVHATEAELEAELRTRPHIPKGKEAKILRRLMSQTGWTEAELRANRKYGEILADAQSPNRRKVSADWAKANAGSDRYGWRFGSHYKVST